MCMRALACVRNDHELVVLAKGEDLGSLVARVQHGVAVLLLVADHRLFALPAQKCDGAHTETHTHRPSKNSAIKVIGLCASQ